MTSPLRRLMPAVLGLAFLASTGCELPGVSWLPDSSGFVFTEAKGSRLVHHDLKKGRRVIALDTGTHTLWPAVSPDGKQVAVARWEVPAQGGGRLQVTFHDMGGKVAHRSRAWPWPPASNGHAEVRPTYLSWARADKVLVFTGEQTAIYDPFHNTLVRVDRCIPWPVGNNPTRPDREGFLATLDRPGGGTLAFVTWDGQERPLAGGPAGSGRDECKHGLTWDRMVATMRTPKAAYHFDTLKGTTRRDEQGKLRVFTGGDDLESAHTFPGGAALAVLKNSQGNGSRVEFQGPRGGQRRVLIPECQTHPWPFPSPDRTLVALYYSRVSSSQKRILVVEAAGKAVADIAVRE